MAAKGKTTAMYGNIATITLIKMMLSFEPETRTARIKNFEAQIFGGAYNPDNSDKDIGKQNIEIAHKILNQNKIAIISEDTGGKKGRKVVFNISSNEAAVLKVDNLRDADWYPYQ
jgi:chemotaxis protein CheD